MIAFLDPLPIESAPPYALWGVLILIMMALATVAWSLIRGVFRKTDARCESLHTKIVTVDDSQTRKYEELRKDFNDYRLKHVETSSANELAQTKRLAEMEAKIIQAIHDLGERSSQEFATKTELRETKEELKLSIERIQQH
jgi:hypothetical protein